MTVLCTFDSTAPDVADLFFSLGFSETHIQDDNISVQDLLERNAYEKASLEAGFLQALSQHKTDDSAAPISENTDTWVAAADAADFANVLSTDEMFRLQPLFSTEAESHGVSQVVAQTLFEKLLLHFAGDPDTAFYKTASIFVDAQNHDIPELEYLQDLFVAQDLPLELLHQMKIAESGVSDFWQDVGQSVLWIQGNTEEASAVVLSDRGDLLTAKHVLYEEDTGEFVEDLYITTDNGVYLITEDMVVESFFGQDLLWLQMPEMAKLENLEPVVLGDAKKMQHGAEIMVIGFPGVGALNTGFVERVYSPGRLAPRSVLALILRKMEVQALVLPGDSGGGLYNEYGELVGISTDSFGDKIHGLAELIPPKLSRIFE